MKIVVFYNIHIPLQIFHTIFTLAFMYIYFTVFFTEFIRVWNHFSLISLVWQAQHCHHHDRILYKEIHL